MSAIKCFMLEPTDRGRIQLIRSNHAWGEDGKVVPEKSCPLSGYSHLARTWIGETAVIRRDNGIYDPSDPGAMDVPHDDPRWPGACECGYRFAKEDNYSTGCRVIYRSAETGEECLLQEAPVGAMWYADWLKISEEQVYEQPGHFIGPDGHCLVVQLPGEWEWCVDGPASGGGGWTRTGTPPEVTASPSVWANAPHGWHGWLRDGYLVEA